MRKKILVRGPALSRSGYGEQTRFALRSLRSQENLYDIYLWNTGWGSTGWIAEDNEERGWIDHLISKTIQLEEQKKENVFDLSLQITIPNEWEKLAPVNIGYTAGIETTKVSPQWVEKSFLMDKIIVVSNHSKQVYENTKYPAIHNETKEEFMVSCETPIDVVHYPVKQITPETLNLDLETDFNFLTVAQWGPRKNIANTFKWFVEEFHDEPVGLVAKVFVKNQSKIDKFHTQNEIKNIFANYPNRKCKVYLLHGEMTDSQMAGLYVHPKIKALITLTHGEGYGLPLFEAAYSGMPVLAPDWSGHCDFLYMSAENKKGKIKKRPYFAKVDYTLQPVQPEAVWDSVVQADSLWCYASKGSYKTKLKEIYKDHSRFISQAKKLQAFLHENFSEEKKYAEFVQAMQIADNQVPQTLDQQKDSGVMVL